jgi:ribosomal protein RSM22 (predicted rRNA methylase)
MPDEQAALLRRAALLIPRPSPDLVSALAGYRQVLEGVHPLKAKHRAGLPQDVKRLSLSLTAERGPGPQANYLSTPANLSAYLYYFLPWNLFRLSRLLSGLDFDIPDGSSVLDLGCGPLTLAQALWIARPQLRERKIRLVCVDQTGQVMRAGRALFEAVSGAKGKSWTIELVQAPAHKAPQEHFHVVMAANALNELARGRGEEGHQGLERLGEMLSGRLSREGRLLLVEPGTRLGGNLLSRLRGILMEEGLSPLSPCTHGSSCPMLAPRWRSWCHFVFPAENAPDWLAKLTKLAGLDKDRASLSFMHMAAQPPAYDASQSRVVSHRFPLPTGQGAYACASEGLRLLTFLKPPQGLVSGALLEADMPKPCDRDTKSGAWITPIREKTLP